MGRDGVSLAEHRADGVRTLLPSAAGQQAWCDLIDSFQVGGVGFLEACTPGVNDFARLLEDRRDAGDLDGMELLVD